MRKANGTLRIGRGLTKFHNESLKEDFSNDKKYGISRNVDDDARNSSLFHLDNQGISFLSDRNDFTRKQTTEKHQKKDTNLMTTRTKDDICRTISMILGKSFDECELVTEGVYAVMQSYLVQGDRIEIRNLGTFEPVQRAPKKVRDIKRNLAMSLPSRPSLRFKPSAVLIKDHRTYAQSQGRTTSPASSADVEAL